MTKSRHIAPARQFWTAADDAILRARYPDEPAAATGRAMNRSLSAIYGRAALLGLHKSAAFMESDKSGRVQRGKQCATMIASQFKPGIVPANKGLRRPGWAPGRMADTQFKKGCMSGAAQHNYVPIGTERLTKDGYVERKVNDDHPVPARRWVGVHRLVWEAVNGQVPAGHAVTFRPGKRTTDVALITIDIVELVSRAELMRRNSYHTKYPKDIALLIQLKGALNRKINRRIRDDQEQSQ